MGFKDNAAFTIKARQNSVNPNKKGCLKGQPF